MIGHPLQVHVRDASLRWGVPTGGNEWVALQDASGRTRSRSFRAVAEPRPGRWRRSAMTVRSIVIATVLLVAAACAESAATSVPVDAQPTATEPLLLGTEWQLVDAVVEGEHLPLDGIDAVLRFDEDGGFSATACNSQHGEVALALTTLTFTPEFTSAKNCVDRVMDVDGVFWSMFGQAAQWSVVDEQLTLIGPATLTFRLLMVP